MAEWLAANGVPAQTTDGAADEDDEGPADEWLWVLEACMLVAAGSPDDLSDDQWKQLAAVYSALIPHVHDPFRWRRDEIGEPSICWPPQGRLGGPAGSPGTGDGALSWSGPPCSGPMTWAGCYASTQMHLLTANSRMPTGSLRS